MSDRLNEDPQTNAAEVVGPERSFWDRHAKLSILLIAGVFYAILIGMCLAVGLIIWQT